MFSVCCACSWREFDDMICCFRFQKISEKTMCSNVHFERHYLYENKNNCNDNSDKFNYKYVFFPFLSFRRNQNEELNFQEFGGMVMKNVSVFSLCQVVFYFRGTLNSREIYIKEFSSMLLCIYNFMNRHTTKSQQV